MLVTSSCFRAKDNFEIVHRITIGITMRNDRDLVRAAITLPSPRGGSFEHAGDRSALATLV